MKLTGTSVAKISKFLENLKDIAGTCLITKSEYDGNTEKYCSYSHINKIFGMSWNRCLEKSGIAINRNISLPITQGRKPKDLSKKKTVSCLRCDSIFESPDPKLIRICPTCKNKKEMIDLEYD